MYESLLKVFIFLAIFLAKHPTLKAEDFDSLRSMVNGAAALGPLDTAKLHERAKREIPIVQGEKVDCILNVCFS